MKDQSTGVDLPVDGRPVITVQLLHTLPDGSSHVDWMIEAAGGSDPDARSLITFRLPADLRTFPNGSFQQVERLADHRRAYLTCEGPLTGDRGVIARLCRGRAVLHRSSATKVEIEVTWDEGQPKRVSQALLLEWTGGVSWVLGTGQIVHSA